VESSLQVGGVRPETRFRRNRSLAEISSGRLDWLSWLAEGEQGPINRGHAQEPFSGHQSSLRISSTAALKS